MKKFDVIIPSKGNDPMSVITTEASIRSLRSSTDDIEFYVVVMEQCKGVVHPLADETVHYSIPFNYNAVLNLGAKHTNSEFILFCNNDLIYHKGFAEALLKVFNVGYKSLSPTNPLRSKYSPKLIHEGYGVNHDLMGWCIAVKRETFNSIGGLDEGVVFWYSDNIYADQLKSHGIKHARVANSFVFHIGSGSTSLRNLTADQKKNYTNDQKKIYENARRKYLQ